MISEETKFKKMQIFSTFFLFLLLTILDIVVGHPVADTYANFLESKLFQKLAKIHIFFEKLKFDHFCPLFAQKVHEGEIGRKSSVRNFLFP